MYKMRWNSTSKEIKFFLSQRKILQSIGRHLASPLTGKVLERFYSCSLGCVKKRDFHPPLGLEGWLCVVAIRRWESGGGSAGVVSVEEDGSAAHFLCGGCQILLHWKYLWSNPLGLTFLLRARHSGKQNGYRFKYKSHLKAISGEPCNKYFYLFPHTCLFS